jgi:hypothetical protein
LTHEISKFLYCRLSEKRNNGALLIFEKPPGVLLSETKEPHYLSADFPGLREVTKLDDYYALYAGKSSNLPAGGASASGGQESFGQCRENMIKQEKAKERFVVLDSFRGLSALFVALFHFHAFGHFYESAFIRNAYLFVDFFFVLSGFVIAHGYSDRIAGNLSEVMWFLRRRVSRVYPLHLFILLLFVGLETVKLALLQTHGVSVREAAFSGSYSAPSLVSNVLFLQSFGLHDGLTWNGPSWSVAVEFWTYLLFAVLWLFLFRFRLQAAIALTTLSLMALWHLSGDMSATTDYGFFRSVHGFFLGVVLYSIRTKIGDLNFRYPTLVEIGAVLALAFYISIFGRGETSLVAAFIFSLAVLIFSYEKGWISRLLGMRPFVLMGLISYSLYMIHSLLLAIFSRAMTLAQAKLNHQLFFLESDLIIGGSDRLILNFGNQWVMDLLAGLYILTLIMVSLFTYRFIEHRFRGFLGRSPTFGPRNN